ncbi:MAG: GMC family oxidoreductase N-terminal domain-containing protein [Bradymonadaceae bacterium]
MIYDGSNLKLPMRIKADLCVVGSGAGGAAAAAVAAEAGLDVILIEAGPFVPPQVMNQREEDMVPPLLYANGSLTTTDGGSTIVQGRALGGSTVHNINLCKRIPDAILAEWEATRGMSHLPRSRWNELYEEIEELLAVSYVDAAQYNRHNVLFQEGCESLGWKSAGLAHNRTGCIGSGFCAVGCAYDAKNNAAKVFIPRLIDAGGQVFTHCQAVRVIHGDNQVHGVEALALDPGTRRPLGKVTIEASKVCLSASATGTAAILIRSKVPDPSGETGNRLNIHPALVAAGEFDEPVRAWSGIPQSYECTEFLDFHAAHPPKGADESKVAAALKTGLRTWLVPVFAHPMSTATILPGWGAEHRSLLERYDRLAVYTAMIHDQSPGTVRPSGDLGMDIDWSPNAADTKELLFGVARAAELLFASGAKRVFIPARPLIELKPSDSLDTLENLDLSTIEITAVHPMSSVPMGDDPQKSAVDSRGKHHHVEGLWVADGSLFPTSIGGPPQISIYALGLHVGRAIAAES